MAAYYDVPPPLFKHGPGLTSRFIFFSLLSLALIVVDQHVDYLGSLRKYISIATHPLQMVAQWPVRTTQQSVDYLIDFANFKDRQHELHSRETATSSGALRLKYLEHENKRLRQLLQLVPGDTLQGQTASIISSARDPFRQKIILDRGLDSSIAPGSPVIDPQGLVGQVTRIFPFYSEATLVTNEKQVVPVQVLRNGFRSLIYGHGSGRMVMRYVPSNADIAAGDLLVTSGLDDVYPAGLPVARVRKVGAGSVDASYVRVYCDPLAAVENYNQVVVLPPRELPAIDLLQQYSNTPAGDSKLEQSIGSAPAGN